MIEPTNELIDKLGINEVVLDYTGRIVGLKGHFLPRTYRMMSCAEVKR